MVPLDLPVIDISTPSLEMAEQLTQAISQHGFVYVKNDSQAIPSADIDAMFDLSQSFFSSPVDIKSPVAVNSGASGKNSGWIAMHSETLDPLKQKRGDFKEAFNLNEFVAGKAQQPLPAPLVPHEAHIGTFVDRCHVLCTDVLRLLALGLGIDEDWFAARHERARGPSGSVFRMLYYPNMPASAHDADDIRAGAHSDYGSVTLLFQRPGQPGLEILTDGSWSPVPVNPGNDTVLPILVNAGDLLSHWTNGLLKSAVHRVVFPSGSAGDRYSLAYFCHPLDDAELVPVPSKLVAGHDRPVLTAQQHLEARLAATMALKGA